MKKEVFPKHVYNPITMIGAAIAALSFGLIIFLFVLGFLWLRRKCLYGHSYLHNNSILPDSGFVTYCLWIFS